jgi:hypothetical protein
VAVRGQPAGPPAAVAERGDRPAQDPFRVHVGDHQVTAGAQHAGELGEHRAQVGDVRQRQPADDEVGARVGDGQPLQLAVAELSARHARAGAGEHLGRAVHPDDAVTALGEQRGDAAGAAGGVHRDSGRDVVQDLREHRLVDVERGIAPVVVGGRPHPVPVHGADALHLHGGVQRLVGEQVADLRDAGLDERAVVLAREPPQERDALEPDQVGQRVLVDHGSGP